MDVYDYKAQQNLKPFLVDLHFIIYTNQTEDFTLG